MTEYRQFGMTTKRELRNSYNLYKIMPQPAEVLEQEPVAGKHPDLELLEDSEAPPEPEMVEMAEDRNHAVLEAISQKAKERRDNIEAAVYEPRLLAKTLNRIGFVNAGLLEHYLEAKQGVFGENSKELSEQLMKVETEIISPALEQVRARGLDEKQMNNFAIGLRESFYSMILNGTLSAEKIKEIFDGQIIAKDKPGEEVNKEHQDVENMGAYLKYENGKFNIYVYDQLLKDPSREISFVLRHEFFHVAAINIWGKRYFEFLEAAKSPHSNLEQFSDVPELKQILYLVSNPRLAKPFFRSYVVNILEQCETETDPGRIATLRAAAAREMVADLGSHFLEGSHSPEVFCDFRMRYFTKNPEELMAKILELEDTSSVDGLLQKYGLADKPFDQNELIEKLSTSIPLTGLVFTSRLWQERLTELFKNKGANLRRPKAETGEYDEELEEFLGGYDDFEITSFVPQRTEVAGLTATGQASQSEGNASPILGLWELITGGASRKQ